MHLRSTSLLLTLALTASSTLAYQAPDKAALQKRVAELKESVAANKAKLAQYQWTETTTILLKGEVKKTEQNLCKYGPDGKVQKTPMGAPAPPPQQPEGREGGGRSAEQTAPLHHHVLPRRAGNARQGAAQLIDG